MSALANTLPANESLNNVSELTTHVTSDISVITRIDYNLRFTQQAVLAVSENNQQYSLLASQYLVSLSSGSASHHGNQINVAFVSASTKLNDIQVRCRLVEQLFVNTLFDPEQSLAVSVLKFAKQHGEAITIVVDHGHALSLQLKYELSQLVNLAKKHKLMVNVVIFGLIDAAYQLSSNKSLFKNKMAIIDADTGQIISLDSNKVKIQKEKRSLQTWHKLSISLLLVLTAGGFVGYHFIIDRVGQASIAEMPDNIAIKDHRKEASLNTAPLSEPKTMVDQDKAKLTVETNSNTAKVLELASSEEINLAILGAFNIANSADVSSALNSVSNDNEKTIVVNKITEENRISDQNSNLNSLAIVNHYYENQAVVHNDGFVIQIAGFSDSTLWQSFVKKHNTEKLFSYKRLLNNIDFIVVTSEVFPTKAAAKNALNLLPESILARKPWLKDISSVINEINTFKD